MKKYFFGSLVVASLLTSNANAVDFSLFGHLGTAYDFGIDKVEGQKPWFGGFTGRLGVELGMGPVSIGVGFAGGAPYAIDSGWGFEQYVRHGRFTRPKDVKWYNWLSDAYLRADTKYFSVVGGRYDTTTFFAGKDGKTHTGVDWFFGQNEGVSFKLDTRYFAWWGIYSYETMDFGARTPRRLGSDLMGFNPYDKSGHLISTGFDINIKDVVYVDPFVTYDVDWKYLQTGGKIELDLGKGFFKSKTIVRGMYQHRSNVNTDTFLGWLDQEFFLGNLFKFGAGGYIVGNGDGILTNFGEATRFYGNTFSGATNYFSKGNGVWYVFAGLEHQYFNFDFIYADGSYKEISAMAQVNIVKNKWAEWGVGGGWIRSNGYDQGVVFTKLSF